MFTSIDVKVFFLKIKDKTLFNFLLFVNDMTSQQLHRKKWNNKDWNQIAVTKPQYLNFVIFSSYFTLNATFLRLILVLIIVLNKFQLKSTEWLLGKNQSPSNACVWIVLAIDCTPFKSIVHIGFHIVLMFGNSN